MWGGGGAWYQEGPKILGGGPMNPNDAMVWPLGLTWKSLIFSDFPFSLLSCKTDNYFQLD